MKSSEQGRQIHGKVEQERERGQFISSLKLSIDALNQYSTDGDSLGFSEVLTSSFLTFRHLFERSGDKNYMILAKHLAMAAVEIAESSGIKEALAIPYARLAQANATLKDWGEAANYFSKAIENMQNNPLSNHDRPAVIADMKAQLSQAQYMNGDKSAKERLEQAIEEIRNSDEPQYNKDVWLSGAFMRGAEMLVQDDKQEAKKYMERAKEVIDTNDELVLRKRQWEELNERLAF